MKKICLSIFGIFLICCSTCFAQRPDRRALFPAQKGNQETTAEEVASTPATNTTNADSLSLIILQRDSLLTVAACKAKEDSIKISALSDSLSSVSAALEKKAKEYDALLEDLDFADQCMMSLAYRRCNEPYNKDNVDKALSYFQKLHKQETKDKYSELKKALQDYDMCYNEVHRILESAQNDSDRAGNPFAEDSFKAKYTDKLHSSWYYTHYMERKAEFHLEYLEETINKALERLSKHTGSKPANFLDLL